MSVTVPRLFPANEDPCGHGKRTHAILCAFLRASGGLILPAPNRFLFVSPPNAHDNGAGAGGGH